MLNEKQTSVFLQQGSFGVMSVNESIQVAKLCLDKDCWSCPLHGNPDCKLKLIGELVKHVEVWKIMSER